MVEMGWWIVDHEEDWDLHFTSIHFEPGLFPLWTTYALRMTTQSLRMTYAYLPYVSKSQAQK